MQNRAVYVAIGVNLEGCKEVLGLWTSPNEGAKFWLQVLTEIKNRGVRDIFVACIDGLKGFPEAVGGGVSGHAGAAVHCASGQTLPQLRVVETAPGSGRRFEADLHGADGGSRRTGTGNGSRRKWDRTHPTISQVWRRNWDRVIPFFAYPAEIRKVIYTTNAVESLNMSLRKIIKTRGSFPNEEAAIRLLYLALRNHSKKWSFVQGWREALNRFQVLWPDRMPALERK